MDWMLFLNTVGWMTLACAPIVGFMLFCAWVEENYDFPLFPVTVLLVVFCVLAVIITHDRMEQRAKQQPVEAVQQ